MGSVDDIEILSLFDTLPRKLPTRRLIVAYAESARWATVKGMCLYSYYRSVVVSHLVTLFNFCRDHGSRVTNWCRPPRCI